MGKDLLLLAYFLAQSKSYFLRPTSRGTVRLASSDPREAPLIDPRYMSTEEDLRRGIQSQRALFDLVNTRSLARFGPSFMGSYYSRCPFNGSVTDEFATCLLTNYGYTSYDLCCTNKMGPRSDSTAVVDSRLRVHGIKRLRVVDASIMPNLISANSNAATIMIGERASDLIREDNGQHPGKIPPIPPSIHL